MSKNWRLTVKPQAGVAFKKGVYVCTKKANKVLLILWVTSADLHLPAYFMEWSWSNTWCN